MLLEKIKKYNIYLASQSLRRQQLLQEMNINFNIAKYIEVDESYSTSLNAEEIAMYLSEKKADAFSFILKENRVLITADTIVLVDEKILGKPKDKIHAIEMLKLLSGKKHFVITGLTIRDSNKTKSFFSTTEVWFRKLNSSEIEFYVDKYKPFDKAGAYGIQEWIGEIGIEKINGSYFNVVGLPTELLYIELDKFLD